jgi:hypothetical protein
MVVLVAGGKDAYPLIGLTKTALGRYDVLPRQRGAARLDDPANQKIKQLVRGTGS